MHAGAQCVSVAGQCCHLQCLQEVTVERRKERSRAAWTIDMMGGKERLQSTFEFRYYGYAHYFNGVRIGGL